MSIARNRLRKESLAALGLICLFFLVTMNFILFHAGSLSADEAYYWDWSRHLDLAYFSKPPMIAYVIRLSSTCFGASEAALRTAGALFSTGTLLLIWRIGAYFPEKPKLGLVALFLTLGLPDFWAAASAIDTNKPLFFFWMLSLYAFLRALKQKKARWWIVLGLALGFALLSKYTILFLLLAFALYLLLADRRWLRSPYPYLAILIMLILNSGVLWWNFKEGWPSLIHTAGLNRPEALSVGARAEQAISFLGSQLFPINPLLIPVFLYGLYLMYRQRGEDTRKLVILLAFLVPFLFYLLVSLDRPVLSHWPFPAYFAAIIAGAYALAGSASTKSARRAKGLLRILSLSGASLVILLALLTRSGLVQEEPRDKRSALASPIEQARASSGLEDPFFCSDDRHLCSLLSYYAAGQPKSYCLQLGNREKNQYDLWGGHSALSGRNALLLCFADATQAETILSQLLADGFFQNGAVLYQGELPEDYSDKLRPYCILGMEGFGGFASRTEKKWH